MKTTLYLTTSVDGYIANEDHTLPWDAGAWENFIKICTEYKNVIVGRKSYELMHAANDLEQFKINRCVVVSRKLYTVTEPEALIVRSPKEALLVLQNEGFNRAFLSGGRAVAQAFLDERLIDELILDVQPIILGKGIQMPSPTKDLLKLELLDYNKSDSGSVMLRYSLGKM